MKKYILIICIGLLCFAHESKAQWVVTDPGNLAQGIGKSSVSCPLKPSDSAPLKHSTMPP